MDPVTLLSRQAEEPILKRTLDRFHFHVADAGLRQLYEEHFSLFWSASEIQPSADEGQWEQLGEAEQHFVSHVLAFFATADGIVFENCCTNFGSEVTLIEARYFYAFQAMIEQVHAEVYMKLLTTYVKCPDKQRCLIDAIRSVPSIKAKADWAMRYFDTEKQPFALRLIAFSVVEAVFFCGSFCAIFWVKWRHPGKLHALTFSNSLIARDESLHADFAVALFHRLVNRPTQADVHALVGEATMLETQFAVDALGVSLIGMSAESMTQWIQYVADRLLKQLGYDALYNAENPFPFMEKQSLRSTVNFFEAKVSEYALAPEGGYGEDANF